MKYRAPTATLDQHHGQPFILIKRGSWASLKVRIDEAHNLADQIVDLAEQTLNDAEGKTQ